MDQEQPKKAHLSVVKKASNLDSPSILTNLESLSEEQKEAVDKLTKAAGRPGPVSGVILGDALWDIRPVVVSNGILCIIRFTDPGVQSNASVWSEYKRYLDLLPETGLVDSTGDDKSQARYKDDRGKNDQGQASQWWLKRPFLKATIAEEFPTTLTTSEIISDLITQLRSLHSKGLVHGHVSPTNVGITRASSEEQKRYKAKLLDPGFCAYSPVARSRRTDIAPELRGGYKAGPATDIYGLGVVIKYLLQAQRELTTKEEEILEKLLGEDPVRRPSLDWVQQALLEKGGFFSKVQNRSKKTDKAIDSSLRYILLGLVFLIIVGGGYSLLTKFDQSKTSYSNIPFDVYWESGQPSAMKQVAEAAVAGSDNDARLVIAESIRLGKNPPNVLASVLKIGLDQRWEGELSEKDRAVLFKVALGPLLPSSLQRVDGRNIEHPAVALAIIGSLPIEVETNPLADYSLERFKELPEPFKDAYTKLNNLGVIEAGDMLSITLAHILLSDISQPVLEKFLSTEVSNIPPLARVTVLDPFWDVTPNLPDRAYDILISHDPLSMKALGWFRSDAAADWVGLSRKDQLLISNGILPETVSGIQLIQLLAYPREDIRIAVGGRLLSYSSNKRLQNIIALLGTNNTKLNVSQISSLFGILKSKQNEMASLANIWFKTKPDISTVLEILIARKNEEENDAFNFAASQYLSNNLSQLKLSVEDAQTLASHKEALARAMAYKTLNASDPKQRSILEIALLKEGDENLKKFLEEKLKSKN